MGGGQRRQGRRTSSDRRSTDRSDSDAHRKDQRHANQHNSQQHNSQQRNSRDQGPPASDRADRDSRRLAALQQLGLDWGASRQAIKTAHRRLVKQHHPDVGGRAEDFHRINEAYQLLVA